MEEDTGTEGVADVVEVTDTVGGTGTVAVVVAVATNEVCLGVLCVFETIELTAPAWHDRARRSNRHFSLKLRAVAPTVREERTR